jgi:hypothetical protein
MKLLVTPAEIPPRLATGAYILHTGLEKRGAGEDVATAMHGPAASAFPLLKPLPPARFLRLLSTAEIALGVTLLAPFVPAAVAGAALTAFSGGLVATYLRSPAFRKPGSIWPNQNGIAISKDVWMLGIGLGLLADAATRRR